MKLYKQFQDKNFDVPRYEYAVDFLNKWLKDNKNKGGAR